MRIRQRFYIAGGLVLIVLLIAASLVIFFTRIQQGGGITNPGSPSHFISPTTVITPEQQPSETAGSGGKAYYVSPSGNDDNDGSQGHPFATIQKAAKVVKPGTIVHVLPGTYTQPVTLREDGTAKARISFISDIKWGAKIKTTGTKDPWTTRADYIDIIGFDITSTGSRDGITNLGSYIRTIGNHVHDIPGGCDSIGGAGIDDGDYTGKGKKREKE